MTEAYIIDAVRTPRGIGKVGKGALAGLHPQHLAATVLKALQKQPERRYRSVAAFSEDVIVLFLNRFTNNIPLGINRISRRDRYSIAELKYHAQNDESLRPYSPALFKPHPGVAGISHQKREENKVNMRER